MGGILGEDVGVVRYKGYFDLQPMLRMIYSHLKKKNYDFYEKVHKAKIPELELDWMGEKKVTPYYKYVLEINIHFYDLIEVEIDDGNGGKRKTNHARFAVTIDGEVKTGYSTDWDEKKSSKMETFKKFFETLTKREFMAKHAQTLILEGVELRDKLNGYLGLTVSE